jgi:twitching motility two-component system response regulator PilG
MQGNLKEIDIPSILQLIEWGQRTGQLLVKAHSWKSQQYWFVFFLNGQIIYCQEGDGSLSRIDDYLRPYRVEMQLEDIQIPSPDSADMAEYNYLWALLEHNMINPKVARDIMYALVYETLFDLLSLHEGSFIFHQGSALTPQLTTWEITPLVTKIAKQLQHWQHMHPHIQAPDQVPILSEEVQLHSSLPAETVNKLQHWADGKTSLRQLARYLNRDICTVAKAIYPYVQQGWLKLVYSVTNESETYTEIGEGGENYKRRIVCIAQATSNSDPIKSILQPQGYEVLTLTNPLESISRVFQLKPDLIFCEMTMPGLDGYEICAMLRQSTTFRLVPIIMLSDRDRFCDRIKAKMVGTTDYVTKPLKDTELLVLIGKYINIDSGMGIQKRYKTC